MKQSPRNGIAGKTALHRSFWERMAQPYPIAAQNALIPDFHGGTALGFYHVYCPGTSIWHQEDLSAIMSPSLYREFLVEPERRICSGKNFTAIHLHPASLDTAIKLRDQVRG